MSDGAEVAPQVEVEVDEGAELGLSVGASGPSRGTDPTRARGQRRTGRASTVTVGSTTRKPAWAEAPSEPRERPQASSCQ